MPDALILEFDGLGRDEYEAVNGILGVDPVAGTGDWPRGLMFHSAGPTDDGWVVFEVWDSQDAQEAFMRDRLGAALAAGGADSPPSRVQWLPDALHHAPAG